MIVQFGPYAFTVGKPGEQWSTTGSNASLPDHIQSIIDEPVFQERLLRGIADQKAGRTLPLSELLRDDKCDS